MQDWQLIDSAPKDGSRVLLFRQTAYCTLHVVIGQWNEDAKSQDQKPYWTHDAEHELGIKEARKFQPTHWIPLPTHPAQLSAYIDLAAASPALQPSLSQAGNTRFRRRSSG